MVPYMGMEVCGGEGGGAGWRNWALEDRESNIEVPPIQWALAIKQLGFQDDHSTSPMAQD